MSALTVHAPDTDRVRANTWPAVNDELDRRAALRTRWFAGAASADELSQRIEYLDREWDFDRVSEAEVATAGLLGLGLALGLDRRLIALSALASSMMLLHAVHGWYPWLPLFRRLGVRTRDEIDRERYALKALRGDFDVMPPPGTAAAERAAAAWQAVCA